jgi:ATP-dependent exoDNAse (exonuclease V) beta subunit
MKDSATRNNLKDINQSKIVIAPAGSGKTSESVKYFLNSLLDCKQPESVLAVTFTNKATAEFRDRVVKYLKMANAGTVPKSSHEMTTYEIAKKVLAKDKSCGWGIIQNPNRLEIKTLDALCASIVSLNPLMSKLGTAGKIAENPEELYLMSAANLLAKYTEKSGVGEQVRILLGRFNNNFEIAQKTLSEILRKRDQWLPLIYQYKDDARRGIMEEHNERLMLLLASEGFSLLVPYEDEIFNILLKAKGYQVPEGFSFSDVTNITTDLLEVLAVIESVFFTKEKVFRKSFSKAQGFVAPSSLKGQEEKAAAKQMKEDAILLVEHLKAAGVESEADLLLSLCAPQYNEQEWSLMSCLMSVLPALAAELLLVFRSKNECDFIEIQSSALRALGSEDEPGTALLKLDNRLRHILIDEFQDCSPFQLQLIKILTSGWAKDDGRTLYLVGDPMQSIYLFRNANVGLFIDAVKNGIGNIPLQVNHLSSNYRSQAGIIEWVNAKFSKAFGNLQDADVGATVYNESEACKPKLDINAVSTTLFSGDSWEKSQAEYIVNQIHQINSNDPNASIAVLGRTRNDLAATLEALREQKVEHRAVDIHRLNTLSSITDLELLTRSICHLADKQAWIGLLRSPFVGLSMADVELLLSENGKRRIREREIVLDRLGEDGVLRLLSASDSKRLVAVKNIIERSREHLGRKSLEHVVKGAYYALGGLSLMNDQSELKAIDTFFYELSKLTHETYSAEKMAEKIDALYAPVEQSSGNIQVMTMHKAKGLEFDYVFLPHTHKPIRSNHNALINFETIVNDDGVCAILSPDESSTLGPTRMNSFIAELKRKKYRNEAIRLAYVAATRAKKQLYLTGQEKKSYPNSSMLGLLDINVSECVVNHTELDNEAQYHFKPQRAVLAKANTKLLPEGDMLASFRGITNVANDELPKMDWYKDGTRIIGIVIHKVIERIAKIGWSNYFSTPIEKNRALWRCQLLQEGLSTASLPYAINEITEHLKKLQNCDFMHWALAQPQIQAEMPVYVKQLGKLKKLIIDITFEVDGVRYIIDNKTGRPHKGETEKEFAHRMLASYTEKMKMYKRCFPRNKAFYVGLYLSSLGKMAVYNFDDNKAA